MDVIRRAIGGTIRLVQRGVWMVLARLMGGDKLWRLIDATGIVVFVGPNGSGKSLAAVLSTLTTLDGEEWVCHELSHRHNAEARRHVDGCWFCEPSRRSWCPEAEWLLARDGHGQRRVFSTVPLLDEFGQEHPAYRPLDDYRHLLLIEHADVVFDEVAGVSDASDSSGVPVQVVNWLHTLRKSDVRLRVTTPAYARCSKPIRQVAQLVVDARSFMPELATTGRRWRPRQAMIYSAYDAFAFADYTPGTKDRLKAQARAAFWRPGSRAESAYDTLAQVLTLGHVTEAGMCAACGGARRRPTCTCPSEVDDAFREGTPVHVHEVVTSGGARTRRVSLAADPTSAIVQ